MIHDLTSIFSQDGLLSEHLANYQPRQAQLLMAKKVAQLLERQPHQRSQKSQNILLCEAGTGTGKTFAYLVPVILSSKQTIISSGTKNLQDQLYRKDLPLITSILEPINQRTLNYSLLKGRSNYICLYRFEKACGEAWYDEQIQAALQLIKTQLSQTEFADISEFNQLKEHSSLWTIVTSTADNCLGGACPVHDDCYVLKARKKAFEADVVVVNHHLLMADLKLKTDTLGELLPSAQTYIIDEAHQLPEIASRFFSRKVSARQIKDLLRDTRRLIAKSPAPTVRFTTINDELRRILSDLIMLLKRYKQRDSCSEISGSIKPLCDEILYGLKKLKVFLEALAGSSAELENCFKRCKQLLSNFSELTQSTLPEMIHWFECTHNSFAIHLTPLSIGDEFKQQLDATSSNWIFTSATLAVNNYGQIISHEPIDRHELVESYSSQQEAQLQNNQDTLLFSYFSKQLGLKDFAAIKLDTPFDYSQQAVLFAPQNLPLPSDSHYTRAVIRAILPIVDWLQGKTFILFTSYRALQEAKEILQNLDYQLFVQGDAPKQQLLDEFKQAKGQFY
ncbi:MAG: ATP-dependent DNA helicase [Thiohalomonas sp.]|nr:ATP-dependent DNA helicase [Thiohalomonas sp.]